MPNTYSAQGDQWTIGDDQSPTTAAAPGNASTFSELTKDLVLEGPVQEEASMERLDFDDGMSSIGSENETGSKKQYSSEFLETQPPLGHSKEQDEASEESVAMKDEKPSLSDDDEDQTVALSLDGRETDDEDKTVALSDNEDDRTIARSVATNTASGEAFEEQSEDLQNTTIAVPASDNDNVNDDASANSFGMDTEDANQDDPKPSSTAESDDDEEMEFEDMPPPSMDKEENVNEPKQARDASAEIASADSDQEKEMEFDDADETGEESSSSISKTVDHSPAMKDAPEDESLPKDAQTPRRSVRARKPRVLYSEERHESVLAKTAAKKTAKPKKKSTPKKKKKKAASEEDWIAATDVLFVETEDKSAVTVKQIFLALEEKFESKITKGLKKAVRNRLRALVSGAVVPTANKEEDDEEQEHQEEQEEGEQKEDDPLSDSEEEDADDEASTYSDDEKPQKRAKPKPRRPKRSTAKAAQKIMEAHRLRQKKRAEELKVRNEEMQLDQTKEDEERQEAIAAKFETNTDELRLKRLEDRLDLLQRLDQTRISVVAKAPIAIAAAETKPDAAPTKAKSPVPENNDKSDSSSGSESEESSSDEEDLVIVGMKKPFKPLKPLHNHLPSRGLQLLKDIRSPKATKKRRPKQQQGLLLSPNKMLSPNKSMGARFALRNALKQKQRKQGNRWLARELGYKTEEDHLKDCQSVAEQKRGLVVKLEQERLKANERKQLRERLLLQEQQGYLNEENDNHNNNDDPEDEAYVPPAEEEEDEEMKLAKEIEQEAARESDMTQNKEGESETANSSLGEKEHDDSNATQGSLVENGLETQPPIAAGEEKEDQDNALSPEMSTPEVSEESDKTPSQVLPSLDDTRNEETVTTGNSPRKENIDKVEPTKIGTTSAAPDESVVTPEKNDVPSEDEGELEFDGNEEESVKDPNRPRNAAWQAMLQREAEKLKKRKKRKGGLVEEEAEEEEEEEIAGLEDFGFSISKKNKKTDEDENMDDPLDEEDLKHVVDDVSDGEGDEDAGRVARKKLEQQEEKARHKEILRRMREGYDGRRGGIAGGGAGARGMHRFDQLVAADNREDAKRLGLLNDDELDSEDEDGKKKGDDDEEEDETALLDKMLKDRFLHRSNVDLEENFSEDEEEEEHEATQGNSGTPNDEEVRTQERLARRFAKRARMQRLEEMYGDSQEFSQQRLIDEDVSMKEELSQMRCGLLRRSSSLSRASSLSRSSSLSRTSSLSRQSGSNLGPRQVSAGSNASGSMFQKTSGSLSIALRASKKRKHRTSFLGGNKAGKETAGAYKALGSGLSQSSRSSFSNETRPGKSNLGPSSLFGKVSGATN